MKTENLMSNLHQNQLYYSNAAKFRQDKSERVSYMSAMSSEKTNLNSSALKTTTGENPSGRLSFKGIIPASVGKYASKGAEKFVSGSFFNAFAHQLDKNSLMADAIIALFLTAGLRPLSIKAMPSKDPVEKKKNDYQIGHSVATGILGLLTTFVVAQPVVEAVEIIKKNIKEYAPKLESLVNKTETVGVFSETVKRVHQPVFLPLRAALTIACVPPLLKVFGLTKPAKAITPQDKAKIDYSFMSFKGDEGKTFKKFTKVATKYDIAKENIEKKSDGSNPSFKGLSPSSIGKTYQSIKEATGLFLAKPIGWLVNFDCVRNGIEKLSTSKKWFPHLVAAESIWLSSFYMGSTATSKKIEKDQKLPMILNQGFTAIICTIGAYTIDGVIKKYIKKFASYYEKVNTGKLPEKVLKSRSEAIAKKLGPVLIFTAIYRFIGPVFVTPIANMVSEWIQPHKKETKAA